MYGDNLNSYWNRIKIVDEQSIVEEDMSSYVMENGVDSDLVNKKVCCDMIQSVMVSPIFCLLFYFSFDVKQVN